MSKKYLVVNNLTILNALRYMDPVKTTSLSDLGSNKCLKREELSLCGEEMVLMLLKLHQSLP